MGWVFIGVNPPNSMSGGEGSFRISPSLPSIPTPSPPPFPPSIFPFLSSPTFPIFPSSSSSSLLCPPTCNSHFPSMRSFISSVSRNLVLPILLMARLGVFLSLSCVFLSLSCVFISLSRVLLSLLLSLFVICPLLSSLSLALSLFLVLSIDLAKFPPFPWVESFRLVSRLRPPFSLVL